MSERLQEDINTNEYLKAILEYMKPDFNPDENPENLVIHTMREVAERRVGESTFEENA